MNATDYIIEKLKNVAEKIDGISLKYAYDKATDFHIVEIAPESIRRGNEEYIKMECDIYTEFRRLFPEENILLSEVCRTNDMRDILFRYPLQATSA